VRMTSCGSDTPFTRYILRAEAHSARTARFLVGLRRHHDDRDGRRRDPWRVQRLESPALPRARDRAARVGSARRAGRRRPSSTLCASETCMRTSGDDCSRERSERASSASSSTSSTRINGVSDCLRPDGPRSALRPGSSTGRSLYSSEVGCPSRISIRKAACARRRRRRST
jgi:hypothetical protein